MNASWLPPGLAAAPFHVTRAHEAGVPWWRLREPHLVRPTRSVRAATAPTTVEERARAFQVALPDDMAFSHVTAARLWGLSLPAALEGQNQLDVMRPSVHNRVRRSGCRGHRGLERRKVATLRGIRVTGLADTWVDLAELGQASLLLEDLVVLGDEWQLGWSVLRSLARTWRTPVSGLPHYARPSTAGLGRGERDCSARRSSWCGRPSVRPWRRGRG